MTRKHKPIIDPGVYSVTSTYGLVARSVTLIEANRLADRFAADMRAAQWPGSVIVTYRDGSEVSRLEVAA